MITFWYYYDNLRSKHLLCTDIERPSEALRIVRRLEQSDSVSVVLISDIASAISVFEECFLKFLIRYPVSGIGDRKRYVFRAFPDKTMYFSADRRVLPGIGYKIANDVFENIRKSGDHAFLVIHDTNIDEIVRRGLYFRIEDNPIPPPRIECHNAKNFGNVRFDFICRTVQKMVFDSTSLDIFPPSRLKYSKKISEYACNLYILCPLVVTRGDRFKNLASGRTYAVFKLGNIHIYAPELDVVTPPLTQFQTLLENPFIRWKLGECPDAYIDLMEYITERVNVERYELPLWYSGRIAYFPYRNSWEMRSDKVLFDSRNT